MEKEVIAGLLGAVGGMVAGIIAALATLRAKGIDQIIEERKLWVTAYEVKFLEERLLEYKKLWSLTSKTSRRCIAKLDEGEARAFAGQLTDWYYADGGMILSSTARNAFFGARAVLTSEADKDGWHGTIVDRFSALRTALCDDLNSRRGPTMGSKGEGSG